MQIILFTWLGNRHWRRNQYKARVTLLIKWRSHKFSDDIYIAPSGVQKERIKSEDMFVLDTKGNIKSTPHPSKNLKESQCTPLFFNAYTMANAGAVIHTHSQNA